MKTVLLLILFLFLFPIMAFAWSGKVVSITDGNTIKVIHPQNGQVKIRLYGIDTPERGQEFGNEAKKYLASLIASENEEIESVTIDHYGRSVGIASHGGKNINEEMV